MRVRIALLLLLFVPLPASAAEGDVRIVELLPDPGSDREFIELWNAGGDVDLTGWTVRDTAGNTFTFTGAVLPAGGRIVVWGGGDSDARGPAWSKAPVWNNGGDQAFLHDATGAQVDVFAYGSADWPDGRSDPVPAAPSTGRSLSWYQDQWIEADPTPGTVAQSDGGSVGASVEDVPPSVRFTDAPAEASPGASIDVSLDVADGNGDPVEWALHGDGTWLANGTNGTHTLRLAVPTDRPSWTLTLSAQDPAGNAAEATHSITIASGGLQVILPPDGLRFPAFPPGASEVLTNGSFTLRNTADHAITPRIDVSDLAGPGTIPVAGRLDIGIAGTWTPYDGPLTALPEVAAGASADVMLRLRDLPMPLPAGDYGTSFTVVA